jgi:hypothetical protein
MIGCRQFGISRDTFGITREPGSASAALNVSLNDHKQALDVVAASWGHVPQRRNPHQVGLGEDLA